MTLTANPKKRPAQIIRFKAIKSGMTEEQYKDWLANEFGVNSATKLDIDQQALANKKLNKLLIATGNDRKQSGQWRDVQIQKMRAIWFSLADAGAVRNTSEAAMLVWAQRYFPKLRVFTFATSAELSNLIERLKKWQSRVNAEQE